METHIEKDIIKEHLELVYEELKQIRTRSTVTYVGHTFEEMKRIIYWTVNCNIIIKWFYAYISGIQFTAIILIFCMDKQ